MEVKKKKRPRNKSRSSKRGSKKVVSSGSDSDSQDGPIPTYAAEDTSSLRRTSNERTWTSRGSRASVLNLRNVKSFPNLPFSKPEEKDCGFDNHEYMNPDCVLIKENDGNQFPDQESPVSTSPVFDYSQGVPPRNDAAETYATASRPDSGQSKRLINGFESTANSNFWLPRKSESECAYLQPKFSNLFEKPRNLLITRNNGGTLIDYDSIDQATNKYETMEDRSKQQTNQFENTEDNKLNDALKPMLDMNGQKKRAVSYLEGDKTGITTEPKVDPSKTRVPEHRKSGFFGRFQMSSFFGCKVPEHLGSIGGDSSRRNSNPDLKQNRDSIPEAPPKHKKKVKNILGFLKHGKREDGAQHEVNNAAETSQSSLPETSNDSLPKAEIRNQYPGILERFRRLSSMFIPHFHGI